MRIETIISRWLSVAIMVTLCWACSKQADVAVSPRGATSSEEEAPVLVFSATYTPEQEENIRLTGNPFLPEQEKNAWNSPIEQGVPARYGVFALPEANSLRAAGINAYYPGRYWTMIRLKTGKLERRAQRLLNKAVQTMESQTNVRFYNAQKDPEYDASGRVKLPNVFVRMSTSLAIGSGNFGMTGKEQYIDVPQDIEDRVKYPDDKALAFFMHALCNVAGMFNEVQRPDRDKYVDIRWDNIPKECHKFLSRESKNYTTLGYFDFNSITMLSSKAYSKNGESTILKKGGGQIAETTQLSELDKSFLNYQYVPYIARRDTYIELDTVVYHGSRRLSEEERLDLQRRMNAYWGVYTNPPAEGRLPKREPW